MYYEAIAPVMLPHLRHRPAALAREPTFAATFTVRAKLGAPVSAPCTWDELGSGKAGPKTFTLRAMAQRISAVGDIWADMLNKSDL